MINQCKIVFLVIIFGIISSKTYSQDTIYLTYNEAINIALYESYTIKSHLQNKKAMESYFMYHKKQFKPLLDFNVFTPSWQESVTQIDVSDGLPVYNSTGSLKVGGNLAFKYILPTGGDISLYSTLYQEHLNTILAAQNNEKLSTDQFLSHAGIGFSQPIFTRNKLKENLIEAEVMYNIEQNNFTKAQLDIVYEATVGFYILFRQLRYMQITKEKLENSAEAYRIAKLKHKSERIAEAEVLIAEVEMEKDKANLSESLNFLMRQKDKFKQQIGLPVEQNIKVISTIKLDTFYIDHDRAIEEALRNRTEIINDSLNIILRGIDYDRAKREREFKGEISAYYNFTGLGQEEGAKTRELFNYSIENISTRPANRGISLTFSYPIYDWGRASAKKQQAQALLNDAQLSSEDSKVTIIREVNDIIRTIEESKRRVYLNEKNEKLAVRSYEISKLRFKNGDVSSQQLAQEQERLSDAQLAFLDSYITYQLAVADLKRKTMWDFKNCRSYLVEIEKR